MSEATKLARPYAKAAFALAAQDSSFEKWTDALDLAAAVVSDPLIISMIKSPKYSSSQVVELVLSINSETYFDAAKRFLITLSQFKRLQVLPEIAELFHALKSEAEKCIEVEITSFKPLSDSQSAKFSEMLKKRLSCDIKLNSKVDASILGGAIIRAGDWVMDGSIRGRMAKLTEALI